MNVHEEVLRASARLAGRVVRTPLVRSETLSARTGADVRLKLETLQHTGSFKFRGALNRLSVLSEGERGRGVVTASTGDHGLAMLRAASETGVDVEIWAPTTTDGTKLARLKAAGARLVVRGAECAETESLARAESDRSGRVYVSAYNDPLVIAGQGTIAVEVLEDMPALGAVVASVGGGGLIAGMAGYLRGERPDARALGALPRNSPVMYESVRAGRIVEMDVLPTLSDATAGGVEPGAITFDLCRELVAGWALVDEREIADAVRDLFLEGHVAEGAAGVAVAGALALARSGTISPGDRICVVLCGRNIAPRTLCGIVAGDV